MFTSCNVPRVRTHTAAILTIMASRPYVQPDVPTDLEALKILDMHAEQMLAYMKTHGSTVSYARHPDHGGKRFEFLLAPEHREDLMRQYENMLGSKEVQALRQQTSDALQEACLKAKNHIALPSRMRQAFAESMLGILSRFSTWAGRKLAEKTQENVEIQLRPQLLALMNGILAKVDELHGEWPPASHSGAAQDDALH